MAADVVQLDGQMVDTALEGQQIKITVKDGKVYLNDTAGNHHRHRNIQRRDPCDRYGAVA